MLQTVFIKFYRKLRRNVTVWEFANLSLDINTQVRCYFTIDFNLTWERANGKFQFTFKMCET